MFDIMSDNIQKQFYAAKGFFYETSLDKYDKLILMTMLTVFITITGSHSRPSQTSKMEFFAKIGRCLTGF